MNMPAKLVSLAALCAIVLPCLLFFIGTIGLDAVKMAALVGTIVWFIATPMWMSRDLAPDASEVEI